MPFLSRASSWLWFVPSVSNSARGKTEDSCIAFSSMVICAQQLLRALHRAGGGGAGGVHPSRSVRVRSEQRRLAMPLRTLREQVAAYE